MIDRRATLKLIGLAPAAIVAAPVAAGSLGAGRTAAIGYQLQAFEGAEFIELTAAPGTMEPLEAFSNSLKVGFPDRSIFDPNLPPGASVAPPAESWQELHCAGDSIFEPTLPPGQPFSGGDPWRTDTDVGDPAPPPTIAPDDEMQGG
jgi:hypothetical protein